MNQLNSTDKSAESASNANFPNVILSSFDNTNHSSYLHTKEFHKMEIPEFERIRTTHYREMPYSYRRVLQDTSKIRIVKRETDGVVYLPTLSTLSRTRSYPSDIAETCETEKKKANLKVRNEVTNESSLNTTTKTELIAPFVTQLNASPNKNLRRLSQSRLSELQFNAEFQNNKSLDLINPMLIPPLVRRSLLDLHQKSMDNLSIQKQCSFETSQHSKRSNTALDTKPIDISESPV